MATATNKRKICVLGGTGFVGHHLINELARQGHEVTVITRHAAAYRNLRVLPTVKLIEANVHDMAALIEASSGHDVLINLVAILNEPRDNGKTFQHVHVDLARKIIETRRHHGIKRILHMSALHAAADAASYYLSSKGHAEDLLHAEKDFQVTSFRPSVIFGPGDGLFNRFASLLKPANFSLPFLPLACAASRFAPVYVNDVVQAMVKSINMPETIGQRYDLCGPQVYTLKQIVAYTASLVHARTVIIGLGKTLSALMANIFQLMPFKKPLTRDNYRSLQVDSICEQNALQSVFGITPHHIEEIVPMYLTSHNLQNKYDRLRQQARRDLP